MAPRKRLGQLLIEMGVIDEHQLNSALGHQKQWGGKIGSVLVQKGLCKEADVVRVLSVHLGMPVVHLAEIPVDPRALKLVARQVAEKLRVFPAALNGAGRSEVLTIAMAEPSDLSIVDQIAFHTGKRIKAVLTGESEIAAAIAQHYGDALSAAKQTPSQPVQKYAGPNATGRVAPVAVSQRPAPPQIPPPVMAPLGRVEPPKPAKPSTQPFGLPTSVKQRAAEPRPIPVMHAPANPQEFHSIQPLPTQVVQVVPTPAPPPYVPPPIPAAPIPQTASPLEEIEPIDLDQIPGMSLGSTTGAADDAMEGLEPIAAHTRPVEPEPVLSASAPAASASPFDPPAGAQESAQSDSEAAASWEEAPGDLLSSDLSWDSPAAVASSAPPAAASNDSAFAPAAAAPEAWSDDPNQPATHDAEPQSIFASSANPFGEARDWSSEPAAAAEPAVVHATPAEHGEADYPAAHIEESPEVPARSEPHDSPAASQKALEASRDEPTDELPADAILGTADDLNPPAAAHADHPAAEPASDPFAEPAATAPASSASASTPGLEAEAGAPHEPVDVVGIQIVGIHTDSPSASARPEAPEPAAAPDAPFAMEQDIAQAPAAFAEPASETVESPLSAVESRANDAAATADDHPPALDEGADPAAGFPDPWADLDLQESAPPPRAAVQARAEISAAPAAQALSVDAAAERHVEPSGEPHVEASGEPHVEASAEPHVERSTEPPIDQPFAEEPASRGASSDPGATWAPDAWGEVADPLAANVAPDAELAPTPAASASPPAQTAAPTEPAAVPAAATADALVHSEPQAAETSTPEAPAFVVPLDAFAAPFTQPTELAPAAEIPADGFDSAGISGEFAIVHDDEPTSEPVPLPGGAPEVSPSSPAVAAEAVEPSPPAELTAHEVAVSTDAAARVEASASAEPASASEAAAPAETAAPAEAVAPAEAAAPTDATPAEVVVPIEAPASTESPATAADASDHPVEPVAETPVAPLVDAPAAWSEASEAPPPEAPGAFDAAAMSEAITQPVRADAPPPPEAEQVNAPQSPFEDRAGEAAVAQPAAEELAAEAHPMAAAAAPSEGVHAIAEHAELAAALAQPVPEQPPAVEQSLEGGAEQGSVEQAGAEPVAAEPAGEHAVEQPSLEVTDVPFSTDEFAPDEHPGPAANLEGWVAPPEEPPAEGAGWLGQALAQTAPLSSYDVETLAGVGIDPSDSMGALRLLAGLLRALASRQVIDLGELTVDLYTQRGDWVEPAPVEYAAAVEPGAGADAAMTASETERDPYAESGAHAPVALESAGAAEGEHAAPEGEPRAVESEHAAASDESAAEHPAADEPGAGA